MMARLRWPPAGWSSPLLPPPPLRSAFFCRAASSLSTAASPYIATTLPRALSDTATTHPDRDALFSVRHDQTVTFSELHTHVRAMAFGLGELGYSHGDVLFTALPAGVEAIVTQFAAAELGIAIEAVDLSAHAPQAISERIVAAAARGFLWSPRCFELGDWSAWDTENKGSVDDDRDGKQAGEELTPSERFAAFARHVFPDYALTGGRFGGRRRQHDTGRSAQSTCYPALQHLISVGAGPNEAKFSGPGVMGIGNIMAAQGRAPPRGTLGGGQDDVVLRLVGEAIDNHGALQAAAELGEQHSIAGGDRVCLAISTNADRRLLDATALCVVVGATAVLPAPPLTEESIATASELAQCTHRL